MDCAALITAISEQTVQDGYRVYVVVSAIGPPPNSKVVNLCFKLSKNGTKRDEALRALNNSITACGGTAKMAAMAITHTKGRALMANEELQKWRQTNQKEDIGAYLHGPIIIQSPWIVGHVLGRDSSNDVSDTHYSGRQQYFNILLGDERISSHDVFEVNKKQNKLNFLNNKICVEPTEFEVFLTKNFFQKCITAKYLGSTPFPDTWYGKALKAHLPDRYHLNSEQTLEKNKTPAYIAPLSSFNTLLRILALIVCVTALVVYCCVGIGSGISATDPFAWCFLSFMMTTGALDTLYGCLKVFIRVKTPWPKKSECLLTADFIMHCLINVAMIAFVIAACFGLSATLGEIGMLALPMIKFLHMAHVAAKTCAQKNFD
jgi:hypothetical protein